MSQLTVGPRGGSQAQVQHQEATTGRGPSLHTAGLEGRLGRGRCGREDRGGHAGQGCFPSRAEQVEVRKIEVAGGEGKGQTMW